MMFFSAIMKLLPDSKNDWPALYRSLDIIIETIFCQRQLSPGHRAESRESEVRGQTTNFIRHPFDRLRTSKQEALGSWDKRQRAANPMLHALCPMQQNRD
jgi:hypothetical protein